MLPNRNLAVTVGKKAIQSDHSYSKREIMLKKFAPVVSFLNQLCQNQNSAQQTSRLIKALSALVRFRLKTHTFRCVLAFRPH